MARAAILGMIGAAAALHIPNHPATPYIARNGFAVLPRPAQVTAALVDETRAHILRRLDLLRETARRKHGSDCDLRFHEVASRQPHRFDVRACDEVEGPGWKELEAAVLETATDVLPRLSSTKPPRITAAGCVISEPGCAPQHYHADGPHPDAAGLYNCFVPLVDVPAEGDGTAFWIGSHMDEKLARAAAAKRLDGLNLDDIEVAPAVDAGNLLFFDYRVVHRGLAAHDRVRPVAYFTISTRDDDVKDDWNWSGERLLDGPEDLRPEGSQG